jgi:hypothetical protein
VLTPLVVGVVVALVVFGVVVSDDPVVLSRIKGTPHLLSSTIINHVGRWVVDVGVVR